MRIAQVAPVYESVPPKLYGGTERVVSYLREELTALGHEVTLFESGDSVTSAKLIPCGPRAIRDYPEWVDPVAFHALQLSQLVQHDFDAVHFHIEYLHFPFSQLARYRHVTTMHGPLPDLPEMFAAFRAVPMVSISNAQRRPYPRQNWRATVHHGLPEELYSYHAAPGGYLVFLGRIAPEKRCERAIEIAPNGDPAEDSRES